MASRFVILALAVTCARAGNLIAPQVAYSSAPAVSSSYFQQASAPVAYAKTYAAPAVATYAAPQPIAYHAAPAPSYGITQQAVTRSLGGGQSVSTYSKALDSPYTSVRKYDTRITNDALTYGHAPVAYSAPLVTKSYAAPVAYTAQAPLAYSAPAPVAYSAPAPYITKTYSTPAYSYAAPGPIVTKAYAAPAISYGAPAPLVAKAYAAPAPVVAKAAIAYSPASVVAHTAFQGYGIEYHY